MIESHSQYPIRTWGFGRPASTLCFVAAGLLGAVLLVAQALFGAVAVPACVFVVVAALCLRGVVHSYPHEALGACNVVTLTRAALVSVLAGAIFEPGSAWVIFAIALVAFALDGVDGWLARRMGLTSAFGARFDMEVDALLGAVLALVLLADGTVGPAILILGFSRYAFVLAGLRWQALQGDLKESFRRKAICVVQIAALLLLLFPLMPVALAVPVSLLAAGALLYSFGADTRHLLRRAR